MIVTLDGVRLSGSLPTGGTLQGLIDDVRRTHLSDRLIVSVSIDDRPLIDQELNERLDQPLGEARHVNLTSAYPRQLAAEAFREVAKQLGDAGGEQAAVADELNAGNVSDAIARFGDFLQVWGTCQKSIVECSRLLGQDLTAMESGGRVVREHLDDLAAELRELRDALEARDVVLLADLLRYEMPETCQVWVGILTDLAAGFGARTQTSSASTTKT